MLHILFSILISLGAFSATEVTQIDQIQKMDAEKQEVIWSGGDEEHGGW
ncbi:MAG: hypothetical protein HKN76_15855 [Saprospiraceae bacterium]|nr:hypothetical protein [Saprospiraceae bacterium]